ncbi:MAG: hypothetical protein WBQ18_14680 [Solirubrobacteraceae bacterium]
MAKTKAKSKASPTVKVSCALAFTLQAPAGQADVTQGATSGNHAGAVVCPAKGIGRGAELDAFTTDAAGDLVGKWQQWFNTGTVYGTYDLVPGDSNPTDSFSTASYTGTFVIKGGTGTLAKDTGKGTIKCATKDSVHYVCKESGKMVGPK